MNRIARLRYALGAALLLALSVGAGPVEPSTSEGAPTDTVTIELRVWQHVEPYLYTDARVWVSARSEGGRWGAFGTVPLVFERGSPSPDVWFGVVSIAGVELSISNHGYDGEAYIRVYACGSHCLDGDETDVCVSPGEYLPFDDGHSRSGRYRYGDLTVEVPRTNPHLSMDRERLLAMRDTLAGTGTLDWKADRHIAEWAGVTVEGSPPRVTKLDLADRGLSGGLTGLLGDLTGLTELRLDGNAITGRIPSKLTQLPQLTHLHLGGNSLQGCVPPSLRTVANTDVNALPMPDCGTPMFGFRGGRHELPEGTYRIRPHDHWPYLVFDVPAGVVLWTRGLSVNGSVAVVIEHDSGPRIALQMVPCGYSGIRDGDLAPAVETAMRRLAESRWWTRVE